MKIVHELNQLEYGGVERVILNIIKYDKENEHSIICYKDGPFRKELEAVGAKIVIVSPEVEVDMEADIIHVHTGGQKSPLAKDLGLNFPVIETIHSPVRSAMPDELIYQRVGVCNVVTKMNSKCLTIYNGLDFEDEKPQDVILKEEFDPEGKLIVGRVGRIGTDKGLEEWLLVCYYLQQRGIDFIPLIVGGEAQGCEGYVGKLKLMAESLPVRNVKWIGHKDDVRPWYGLMDVFFYPSRGEGFGLVFAEAMNANCPVVATRTPVTEELFSGYADLVPIESGIMGLVDKMEKMLETPELRSELGNLSRGWVQSEFQAEAMSLEYQELYHECYNRYPSQQSTSPKTNVVFTR